MPNFDPIYPWPITAAFAAALFAMAWLASRVDARRLTLFRARTLFVIRVLAALTLLFSIVRPALRYEETSDETVQILIARDASRSMNTADGPSGATRWQSLHEDLSKLTPKWESAAEKLNVRQFAFDVTAREANLPESLTSLTPAEGQQTAMGALLETMGRETEKRRTVAVLLLGDGAQRALPPNDRDPLLAAQSLGEKQIPVYTIGYGAATREALGLDLAVEDLVIDPVVFERKTVPISVRLRGSGARGRRVKLRVLLEDRTGLTFGQSGEMVPATGTQSAQPQTELTLSRDPSLETVDLSFVPNSPGEFKVAVEVEPQPGELLLTNNRVETIITVRQGGLRVAYFDKPRLEQRWIRMVNGEDKIQLDFIEVRGGRQSAGTGLDPALFERGRYDVYLIGDVPASSFGAAQLRALAQRLSEGAGFMMTGGYQNFANGGYAASPLADYFPVRLDPGSVDNSQVPNQETEGLRVIPTDLGLRRFVMQLDSADRNRQSWETLAPLEGGTRLQPRVDNPLVEVWAQTPEGKPLLVAGEVGKARVLAFGGDTTWRWAMAGRGEDHQRFWRQAILWLARKEIDSDQPIWVRVDPRGTYPGQSVTAEFGVRENDTNVTYGVELIAPDGTRRPIAASVSAAGNRAEIRDLAQPGDYWVSVSATRNGASVGLPAMTRFLVDARDLELDQPSADYDLLKQIASVSGGQLVAREEIESLIDRLLATRLSELTRVRSITLWDNWPLLLTFIGLQTLGWFLRKKWGLV